MIALGRTLLALVAGVVLVVLAFDEFHIAFDEAAFSEGTVSLFGRIDGEPVHCTTVAQADPCVAGVLDRGLDSAVLWFGNSQLHAVNQPRPGTRTAPVLLAEALHNDGVDLVTFSQPNANLQEHRLLLEHLLARLHPNLLILPVVFDDTREDELRAEMRVAWDEPAVRDALSGSALAARLEATAATAAPADDTTPQDMVESAIEVWLDDHVSWWRVRPQARGWLSLALYRTRNWALGISATSTRALIPAVYRRNMEALAGILARCREADVAVIVYVVPLRNDVAPPYVPAEYAAFKDEVARLAAANGAVFANLEDLVPAAYWGTKASTGLDEGQELDFMHFGPEGHELLARAVARLMGRELP